MLLVEKVEQALELFGCVGARCELENVSVRFNGAVRCAPQQRETWRFLQIMGGNNHADFFPARLLIYGCQLAKRAQFDIDVGGVAKKPKQ